jgi:uncharacterized membrane protein YfcA
MLIVGGLVIAVAAAIAGASGFGLSLLSTPFLLLAGFSLPFVITINLLTSLVTRAVVAYRFRRRLRWQRALLLVAASVPGLYLGALTLRAVSESRIRLLAGVLVVLASLALVLVGERRAPRPVPGGTVFAGFAGGFLGTTASLNGVPPVLLLTHERVETASFFADLAVYAIGSAAIGLLLLGLTGSFSDRALFPAFVAWLPGALVANAAGVAVGVRLPQRGFRLLTLAVVFVAGVITVAKAA